MVNEKKVKLMTKLALYEQNHGKEDIPMSKYYKTDYVGLNLINSTIVASVGYFLILLCIILINIDNIMKELVEMDYIKVGKDLLFWYVIVLVVNTIVSYIVYTYRFKKARNNLKEYNGDLKELYLLYKEEKIIENSFYKLKENEEDEIEEAGGTEDDEFAGN